MDHDKQQQGTADRLYTTDEAAKLLRVSRRKIIQMGTAGEVEMIKMGPRTIRFTEQSIRRWLKPKENNAP